MDGDVAVYVQGGRDSAMRVFAPLSEGHPLVASGEGCPLCRRSFQAGERIMLVPARIPLQGHETVPAIPVHATCALEGARTPVGVVQRVKDGDGNPFPLVTDRGQFRLEEGGYWE